MFVNLPFHRPTSHLPGLLRTVGSSQLSRVPDSLGTPAVWNGQDVVKNDMTIFEQLLFPSILAERSAIMLRRVARHAKGFATHARLQASPIEPNSFIDYEGVSQQIARVRRR